jgi:hypothetical protein
VVKLVQRVLLVQRVKLVQRVLLAGLLGCASADPDGENHSLQPFGDVSTSEPGSEAI